MAGGRSLSVCAGLLLLAIAANGALINLNSCTNIENCFQYHETPNCNDEGKRQVCIFWRSGGGCAALAAADRVKGCFQNDLPNTKNIRNDELFCDDKLVPGGSNYTFGIMSEFNTGNTHSGSVSIVNYPSNPAFCKGFTSVCDRNNNNDFALTFKVSECAATTTTTVTTTTTTVDSCPCTEWANFGSCSTTCGSGLQEQRRTCASCNPAPLTTQFISCQGNPDCAATTTSLPLVAGAWGPWGAFSSCTVSCGGGTQTRTRNCNNPAPSNGGLNCPLPASEDQRCNVEDCPVVRRGRRGGANSRRRRCRRRARARGGDCAAFRGAGRKACLRRVCP